jgi:hypothetical protein
LTVRRGAGLAELIVALTLAAIVSAAGVAALEAVERYMQRARVASDARRTLREAEAVLATDLRSALSDSVRVRGDTAVDFYGEIGASVVCVVSAAVLILPPDIAASGAPYSSWRAEPEAGDVLSVFDTTGAGVWRTAIVDSASTPVNGAGCKPSSGLLSVADSVARRPFTRVVLHTSLNPAPAVGAPVRVARPGRYALTRAADGSWSLSYRRCTGSCAVAQPVAGPLAAPSDSGLIFRNDVAAQRVDIFLRTPATPVTINGETAVLRVAVRNRAAGVP